MFTKRSWESFYSGLIMVGLVFMVFPVIYFCGATKEKQILPPAYHVSAGSGDLRD